MNGRARSFLMLVAIVASLIILVDGSNAQNEPLTKPDVYFEFHQEEYSCSVEPGTGDNTVFVTGDVYCKIPQAVPDTVNCIVTLLPQGDFIEIVGEKELYFSRPEEVLQMSFNVRITEGIYKLERWITLEGTWRYDNGMGQGEITPVYCKINILKYGSTDLNLPEEMNVNLQVEQGGYKEQILFIQNLGNGDDWFNIQVICDVEGVSVTLEEYRMGLQRGKVGRLFIRIEAEEDAKGTGLITITATSENPGVNYKDVQTMNVEVVKSKGENIGITMFIIIGVLGFGISLLIIAGITARRRRKAYLQEYPEEDL